MMMMMMLMMYVLHRSKVVSDERARKIQTPIEWTFNFVQIDRFGAAVTVIRLVLAVPGMNIYLRRHRKNEQVFCVKRCTIVCLFFLTRKQKTLVELSNVKKQEQRQRQKKK